MKNNNKKTDILLKKLISEGFSGVNLLKELIRQRNNLEKDIDVTAMLLSEHSLNDWNDPEEAEIWDSLWEEKEGKKKGEKENEKY